MVVAEEERKLGRGGLVINLVGDNLESLEEVVLRPPSPNHRIVVLAEV